MSRTVLLFLLAVLSMPAPGAAQATHPDDRNAAIKYLTMSMFIDPELRREVNQFAWRSLPPEPKLAALPETVQRLAADLEASDIIIPGLLRAAALERCSFEPAYEDGPLQIVPQAGELRFFGRLLRLDARRLLSEGDNDGATERIQAMLRIGEHLSRDRVLICNLVAAAILAEAAAEIDVVIAAGGLTDGGRQAVLSEMRRLDANDPYRIGEALAFEFTVISAWIREQARQPRAGAKLAASLREWGFGQPEDEPRLARLATLDEEGLIAAIEELKGHYDRVQAIWREHDAAERLALTPAQVRDYGPLMFFAPAANKAREAADRAARTRQRLIDQLSDKNHR